MNKKKNYYLRKGIAVFFAVIFGTAAAAGILVTCFTLRLGLYQNVPEGVFLQKAKEMQAFYSEQIARKINNIFFYQEDKSIDKNKKSIYAQLNNYPGTDNFEYGIIFADTLEDIDITSMENYVYQNFEETRPDHNSLCRAFVINVSSYQEEEPALDSWESLISTFMWSDEIVKGQTPGPVCWVISNVKIPVSYYSNDIFAKEWTILYNLYDYSSVSLSLAIILTILFLLSAFFCCHYSRKCVDDDRFRVTWRHKIPLILYLCFYLGIAGSWLGTFFQLLDAAPVSIGWLILLTAAGILALLFFLMNLTVRYHAGTLWKHTLMRTIYNIFSQLYREHTSLLVKGIIVIAAISVLELLANHYLLGDYQSLYIFLFIYKLIEVPLIFAVLLQMKRLQEGSRKMAGGELENKIDTNHMFFEFRKHGEYLNQIQDGMSIALEERMRSEHFKTELITNVSHDIKTPLTSIINYVDLLQKEGITEEERNEYLSVLDRQAARLKKLIEDLIEASKASTGNLVIHMETCDVRILLAQIAGEFEEKLQESRLELVIRESETPVAIKADNRHLWRIFDNLMNNICKYAQPDTRVYINQEIKDDIIYIIFRNISRCPLDVSGDELMERFVRGDESRNSEGSGLGLSIARSLAESMNGSLTIVTDGDLFKAIVSFPYP